MAATIVAVINFKGGVGKTSNVVNLAAALAHFHEKKVLVVDLDAQCSASLWLMQKAHWKSHTENPKRTVYQAFMDQILGTERFDFDEAVVRGVPRTDENFSLLPTLDLLPASLKLLEVEEQIRVKSTEPFFKYLYHALRPHLKGYDYVLLDCPPSFHSITKNGLFLAQHLFVPYIPDFLSLSGFQMFAGLVSNFAEQVAGFKSSRLRSGISAVIVNRYQRTGNVYDEGIAELKMLLETMKSSGLCYADAAVLEPPVRNCVRVAESPDRHLPVNLHAPGSIGAQDYADLAGAVLAHLPTA